jgi:molybdenum cofactor guanylyltransferase
MHAKPNVVGVVIAGGRSVRFGGEKAVAMLAGVPLLTWATRRLQASCRAVAVNARPGTQAAELAAGQGHDVLHDLPGDPDGPLSGVKAGLAWASSQGASLLAVSPCDVPSLPADLFPRLLDAALGAGGVAMAETDEGRQPLCSIWPVTALPALAAALTGGAHPPTWRMLEELGAVRVRFESPQLFANVNTRADLATIAERLLNPATSGTDRR